MDDYLRLDVEADNHVWRTDTETADAIGVPVAFQVATAWSKSLPAELVQRLVYKSSPTLLASIIIRSTIRGDRRHSRIVSLDHFEACAAVVQHAVNLWSRNAARQKVPTLDLMEALYVEGLKQEQAAHEFKISQQAISIRIGRALEIFDREYGHLCRCDDLSLLAVCYNASIGWKKRFEHISRLQDSIVQQNLPFRFRKVPKRQSFKTITWQPGEREALIQSYIDNGGTITKCPTPPNWWSDVTTRPRQRKINLAVQKRHEAHVEKYLRGSRLITSQEISDLNREAA
jgi:hypothetical protein